MNVNDYRRALSICLIGTCFRVRKCVPRPDRRMRSASRHTSTETRILPPEAVRELLSGMYKRQRLVSIIHKWYGTISAFSPPSSPSGRSAVLQRRPKRLAVSPSAMSHAIRGLEETLGVRLLTRTTRSVAPAEAGEQLLARLRPALTDVRDALDQLSGLRDKAAGSCPALWTQVEPGNILNAVTDYGSARGLRAHGFNFQIHALRTISL